MTDHLTPYEQWMVQSNVNTIRAGESALEIIARLRANGYPKIAEGVAAQVVQTAEDARQQAIDWQVWFSERSMSYGELVEWQAHFEVLAEKFDLTDEFKENAII